MGSVVRVRVKVRVRVGVGVGRSPPLTNAMG